MITECIIVFAPVQTFDGLIVAAIEAVSRKITGNMLIECECKFNLIWKIKKHCSTEGFRQHIRRSPSAGIILHHPVFHLASYCIILYSILKRRQLISHIVTVVKPSYFSKFVHSGFRASTQIIFMVSRDHGPIF